MAQITNLTGREYFAARKDARATEAYRMGYEDGLGNTIVNEARPAITERREYECGFQNGQRDRKEAQARELKRNPA